MGNILSDIIIKQTFDDPQVLRSKISKYQTKGEKEGTEATYDKFDTTVGDKPIKVFVVDSSMLDDNVRYFNEYLYVWLGHQNYNELRKASKGFYGWNSHSFEMITIYIDLYRENKLDRDEYGIWRFTDEPNDWYVKTFLTQAYDQLNALYGADLNTNCPHKDTNMWWKK